MNPSFVETLETRRLFAGVILEATGRLGLTTGWMQTMADEITTRLGGPSQVPQFVLSVNANPNTGTLVPSIQQVAGTGTPQTDTSGEIIVLIDYYNVSASVNYSSTYIGSTIANYLETTPVDGILLTSLPINEIGLSRGSAVLDQVANTLGQSGIWVDQETDLDPEPITAQSDPASTIYSNVEFADDYWRNDGSASQQDDGNPVNGAYNLNTYWLDSDDAGYTTPHLALGGYYNGTIDLTATEGGDGPIYANWYGNSPTMPARDETGFVYNSLVGAPRPLTGLWAASGGTGARTAVSQVGAQWGNASDLTITNGNTVTTGNPLQVSFIHQDRGGADNITFYLDSDRNPYNNNFVANLGTFSLAEAAAITQGTETLSTAGVAPGSYWLCAQVTNANNDTRYTYESITAPLTIQGPTVAAVDGSVVLKNIAGTTGLGSLAGFRVTLTQHIKHEKIVKYSTVSNAAGLFSFNNLAPSSDDVVQILPLKGYKLAPHARASYTVQVQTAQITSGVVFSEDLIIPPTKKKK
jgi:hypothetical protein